jgi:multidrug efflux pump subunit AcrA (membrane-fusion protein)
VEDTSHYQLEATLPAEGLTAAKKNAPARVELDALPGVSLPAKIGEVEAGVDPASHTLKARIDLPKEAGVQSGMFGRAFLSQGQKNALVVPTGAIVAHGQLRGIYIVDESGLIHWRVVTLGKPLGNDVEVLSGVDNGDAIVLDPGSQELDGKKTAAVGNSEKH